MEKLYYPINEELARRANDMISHSGYKTGSKTEEYKAAVDKVYALAEKVISAKPDRAEKVIYLSQKYARLYAEYLNKDCHITCMCPSILISGAGNFPVKKKEKQNTAWEKNHQFYTEKIEPIPEKIENIFYCKEIIKSGDADAIERLEEKLELLKDNQELMKGVNKYHKDNGTVIGCPLLTEAQAGKIQKTLEDPNSWYDKPFPPYKLSNNNQNIHTTEKRLNALKAAKEKGNAETKTEWCQIVENTENMRLQLFFDDKPEQKIRDILIANGFRWAPSVMAWQRHLNTNGKYALKRVLGEFAALSKTE